MTSWQIGPGSTVLATDASGDEHRGVVTYGPARDRDGIRGKFIKVWVRFDDDDDEEEVPWPLENVRLGS